MNRDALLATLIGFGLGLIITGAVILAPNITKGLPKISWPKINLKLSSPKLTPTQIPTPTGLSIDSPLPNMIENKETILVSGSTTPNTLVVIAGLLGETVETSKEDGKFAGKITLSEGRNDLVITSYSPNKTQIVNVTVFYTPEEL